MESTKGSGSSAGPDSDESSGQQSKNEFKIQLLLLALIALATFAAYSPVMFNFFNGDDFVHLTWLSRAIHQPELVWRNFYTSWLDGTTTKFYRPLISVFMVSDYALYGLNGLGFRITNLICLLTSTGFIFFIAKQLQQKSQTRGLSWPFFAAALFALYPLHPEAVSWITGRVDSVVTPFCLASAYFYFCYSQSRRLVSLALSLVAMVLGLLSKEMAITLPAVFVLYELIFNVALQPASSNSNAGKNGSAGTGDKQLAGTGDKKKLVGSLKPLLLSLPFWILLALYFVVRYFALGTFVGGYDNSLLFIANPKEFLGLWIHAVSMFLFPLNKALMPSHHIISKLYPAATIYCIVLALLNVIREEKSRRTFIFLAGWLVLCLVPVYKIFNISNDLQGSRLAYLATVPLCMLLSSGLMSCSKLDRIKHWKLANTSLMTITLGLAAFVLWTNNIPWQKAGEENNAIRASLQALYNKIEGDPEVLLLGLPDQIDGAYTCRNSLDGMTKKPQMNRDINRCLMVNAFDPIFPFGYLKDSISKYRDKLFVFRWDSTSKKFIAVDINPPAENETEAVWTKEKLKSVCSIPEQKLKPELSFDASDNVVLKSAGKQPQFMQIDLGKRPAFNCDFVEMDLELQDPAQPDAGADLLYTNDMFPDFELRRRTRTYFKAGQKQQHLIFPLRGLPEWSMGGDTHAFRLLFPQATLAKISSIAIVPKQFVMPAISFANSDYFGSKGFMHLSEKQKEQVLDVDVSKVKGAKKFAIEITRTNLLFEAQNPQIRSKVTDDWMITDKLSGQVKLHFEDFKSAGLYELRVFPLSADDTICGAGSDHLAISVDPKI